MGSKTSCGEWMKRKPVSRGWGWGGVCEEDSPEFVLGVRSVLHKAFQPGGKALKVGDAASAGCKLEKKGKSKWSR